MENNLKILQKIQKVEVPPYLYENVLQALKNRREETLPMKSVWLAAAGICLLLMLNYTAITAYRKASQPDLVEIFSLQPKNTISYEKE